MCAKVIIHTLMCAEIIIHTLNVCENNYSHNECVNNHFCTHSMCVEIIIHTLGVVWFCRFIFNLKIICYNLALVGVTIEKGSHWLPKATIAVDSRGRSPVESHSAFPVEQGEGGDQIQCFDKFPRLLNILSCSAVCKYPTGDISSWSQISTPQY